MLLHLLTNIPRKSWIKLINLKLIKYIHLILLRELSFVLKHFFNEYVKDFWVSEIKYVNIIYNKIFHKGGDNKIPKEVY